VIYSFFPPVEFGAQTLVEKSDDQP